MGVTYAEPAIGALKAFGASVNPQEAPYLYEILNNRSETLVVMVGAGVGIAAVIGTIRFIRVVTQAFDLFSSCSNNWFNYIRMDESRS